jgi:hypothetical protein
MDRNEFERFEPRSEGEMHRFVPRSEPGALGEQTVAECSCGWIGGAHLVAERGYEEALAEHRLHASGGLLETEVPA